MHLTIVAATQLEIAPFLEKYNYNPEVGRYERGDDTMDILITGVGSASTIYVLAKYLQDNTPDLIIQAGIGGGINDLDIAGVYSVGQDEWLDYGIEHADGSHETLYDAHLVSPDAFPYKNGILYNENTPLPGLDRHHGGTVHQVLGTQSRIDHMTKNSDAEIISMEGAAFFFVMLQEFEGNFHQIRAISNKVEPRNKAKWELDSAIKNLNNYLIEMHDGFFYE